MDKPIISTEVINTQFEIVAKRKINHDCYIYDLKWVGPKFYLGIGQHFKIIETIPTIDCPEGQTISRKYTPISSCQKNLEMVELLIKIYRPNSNPKFPKGGKMTPFLQKLQVGGKIPVQGPYGKFNYKPKGIVTLDGVQHKIKRLFFIAGGSGITPCYQTIKEIIAMPEQTTQLILLFANRTEDDIILRKELQQLQPRLKLHLIVSKAPQNWKHLQGHIDQQLMEKICPLNDPETIYIHCGPGGFNHMIRTVFGNSYPGSTIFKY